MSRRAAARFAYLVLLLGGWLASPLARSAALAEPPAAPAKVCTIEGITEYRLPNGLRVLLFPDPSTPNVTVNLTVFVGSRHEGYGETGMAHLLEHMLFKGTPTHKDIPKALKEHGAQYNGTTWLDRTNYFETMPATDENLDFALRLEADRLVNSLVRREDLLSEMTVVRNEFEAGENSPENILSQRMLAAAYEWHNYGKVTIGNRSDIERVPIERLQAFYRKHYRPDNAMLVVAGKFDPAQTLSKIAELFGPVHRTGPRPEETYTEEPPQDGERLVALRRVGKVSAVGAVYHIPAGAHEDFPAVEVLEGILTSEPSGRLYQALVTTKKASHVRGQAYALHDPGILEFIAQVDKSSTPEEVRAEMTRVLEGLAADPVKPEEVERIKRELLAQRELLVTKSNVVGRILSEWAALGDWRLFFLHRDRLQKVTAADVNRVAARYLLPSNRTLGIYYPTESPLRAAIPQAPPAEELVKNYTGGKDVAAGEAFDPTPENVERRVERSEPAPGVKLALLPKKTRGEAVVLQLNLHYGNEDSLRGKTSATQFLATLMARGTKTHTRQQIRDRLNELGARLRGSGLLGDATFTVECKRGKLAETLTLLGEILREPTFPQNEFDVLKRSSRDQLAQGMSEPTQVAVRDLQRRLNPYPSDDVRYVPTIEESMARLDKVTVDEVRKLYEEQLGTQRVELAVVGDFDPEVVRAFVRDRLAGWKAPTPYRRIERPAHTEVAGARQTILTPDKANAFYVAGESIAMGDTDTDHPALEVADFLLGGGALSSRLGNRIRQKEGLSYGVQSNYSAGAKDKAARFLIAAICNPANMDKVDRAVTEELDKLMREGVGEAELAEAKKGYLEETRVQRANDSTLAAVLAEELSNNRTLAHQAELERKVAALTPAEINAAIRRRIDPSRLVVIHAGDFKKQTPAPPAR